jgi:hypothetical protein
MSELVCQPQVLPAGSFGGPQRFPATTARGVRQAEGRAVVNSVRVHGLAYVSFVAMHHAASLGALEEQLIKASPLAESRLARIGDTFAEAVAGIIGEMRWS